MATDQEISLFVFSAPSGAGKTTIIKALREQVADLEFSISATTRAPRYGEEHGVSYFFLSKEEFEQRILAGDLIEYEEIFGNYYGTLKSEVAKAIQSGKRLIFDIDVKGALSVRKAFPDQTRLIFIKPPSLEILKDRLQNRKTESEEQLSKRLERAEMEIAESSKFDAVVVNDNLADAIASVVALSA